MQITKHHLSFLEEAKADFVGNDRLETYRNKDADLIALRQGMDRDCVEIFELGQQVAFFAQAMDKAPELIVPTEREEVRRFASEMETQLMVNDHKGGWENCDTGFLMRELDKNLHRLTTCLSHSQFRRRCANIANFAMMLSDNDRREEKERAI